MGIDKFIENDENSDKDEFNEFVGNKYVRGEIKGDVRYPHNDNHVNNTKHVSSIQLAKLGYTVQQDYEVDGFNFDVRAKNEELRLSPIFVKIGDVSLSEMRSLYSNDGYLLMVKPGDSMFDVAGISLTDNSQYIDESTSNSARDYRSIINQLRTVSYLNSNGDAFTPRCNSIHVEKFKQLADILLSNHNYYHNSSYDELSKKLSTDSYNYTENDIAKVLKELGFIV